MPIPRPVTKVQSPPFEGWDWGLQGVVLHRRGLLCGDVIIITMTLCSFPALVCRLGLGTNTSFSRMMAPGNGFLLLKRFFGLRLWWSVLVGVVLVAVVFFGSPAVSHAAWRLPKRQVPAPTPMGASARVGSPHLQEVSPPVAVDQFKDAVGEKLPQVEILEPANGAMVANGTWTLRVKVSDWPLIDGGSLGLGPHLLAILDGEPPRVLTATQTEMPPLSLGSHRLTVVAAWPWGEVIKSHGAFDQIRVHRAAANPLVVPAPGSAQLLVTSPNSNSGKIGQPVLVDWLLIDAPLQNLRQDDASWRLRITVNGESFLVDQQTPLWLNGWRSGANTLLWELVDGRGEALNPPFNSIVSELNIEDSRDSKMPWLRGRMNADELAILLGNAPPANLPSLLQEQDQTDNEMQKADLELLPERPAEEVPSRKSPGDPGQRLEDPEPDRGPDPADSIERMPSDVEAMTPGAPSLESLLPEPLSVVPSEPEAPLAEASSMTPSAELRERNRAATSLPDTAPGSQDRKDVLPPARELVNPDGTMIRPPSEGFLARLGQGVRRRLGPS